jgi:uncharacterized membrane protein
VPDTPPETGDEQKNDRAAALDLGAKAAADVSAAPRLDYLAGTSGSVQATITHTHRGPIPTAAEFAEYQRALPGAGQWLLEQAALDAEHLRDIERRSLQLANRQTTLQQIVPAITVSVALVTSGAIAIFANAGAGAAVFAATIASILAAYLTGQSGKIQTGERSSGAQDNGDHSE